MRVIDQTFAWPGNVSLVEPESAELCVASTSANEMNTLGADFSHGRLASQLKLPLLPVCDLVSTSIPALVPGAPSDS